MRIWHRARRLLHEQMEPGRAAAAVMVGITMGIVPIYGLQAVVALGLATVLRLNRALTLAATFINNPFLQPFLLAGSFQLGHRVQKGTWVSLTFDGLRQLDLATHVSSLAVGSTILSLLVGVPAAAVTYLIVAARVPHTAERRAFRRFVAARYAGTPGRDRGFARWKTRLDRVFDVLLRMDLGSGPVVDLGCGYGITLALVAFRDPSRSFRGCDLDERRVDAARIAMAPFNASVEVGDIRTFEVTEAGLILIMDVLQYIDAAEQRRLLERCAAALRPGGVLVARGPDTGGGWRWRLTKALDIAALRTGGTSLQPRYQDAATFADILANVGLSVRIQSYRNTLPLRHIIIHATRPGGAS